VSVEKKYCRVQVWKASPCQVDRAQWRALLGVLDRAERLQAARFKAGPDRQSYVLAHGLRRLVLAARLAVPATALVFGAEPGGRPRLLWPPQRRLFFSHSHTRGGVLLACSSDVGVGIDIERMSPAMDLALLKPFMALPVQEANDTFYRYWTALEAFGKATGLGLPASTAGTRVRCQPHALGLSLRAGPALSGLSALVLPVTAPADCVASLALHCPGTGTAAADPLHNLGTPLIAERSLAQAFERRAGA
jgi:4'-phosphopantetheinyl transferase